MIENDYQPAPFTEVNGIGYVYKTLCMLCTFYVGHYGKSILK